MDDDPKPPTQQATQPYSGSTGSIFWAPLGFAAVLALAYLILLAFIYASADRIADAHWSRVVYVAGGLSALVSTAIGWCLDAKCTAARPRSPALPLILREESPRRRGMKRHEHTVRPGKHI